MLWTIEVSPEVDDWYQLLSVPETVRVDAVIERLATRGNQLGMPHSRALGSGLYELRFNLSKRAQRITYVFDLDRRVITLTVFHKQRNNEKREILRARRAQRDLRRE